MILSKACSWLELSSPVSGFREFLLSSHVLFPRLRDKNDPGQVLKIPPKYQSCMADFVSGDASSVQISQLFSTTPSTQPHWLKPIFLAPWEAEIRRIKV
jgi:hypothetical protein